MLAGMSNWLGSTSSASSTSEVNMSEPTSTYLSDPEIDAIVTEVTSAFVLAMRVAHSQKTRLAVLNAMEEHRAIKLKSAFWIGYRRRLGEGGAA